MDRILPHKEGAPDASVGREDSPLERREQLEKAFVDDEEGLCDGKLERGRGPLSNSGEARGAYGHPGGHCRAPRRSDVARPEVSLDEAVDALRASFDAGRLAIDAKQIAPRKADLAVHEVALLWIPWAVHADGRTEPAMRGLGDS